MNKRAPNEFETHAMKSRLNIILIAVYGKKQPETLYFKHILRPLTLCFPGRRRNAKRVDDGRRTNQRATCRDQTSTSKAEHTALRNKRLSRTQGRRRNAKRVDDGRRTSQRATCHDHTSTSKAERTALRNKRLSRTPGYLRTQYIVRQCKYRSPQKCTRAKTETDRIFVVQT